MRLPYRAQNAGVVRELVKTLESHQIKGKSRDAFQCKKSIFDVDNSAIKVNSWKLSDWDYKKPGLPTHARGLFTYKNSKDEDEIAIRGYDKFFNPGEVAETRWPNIMANTRGPYELSVKENGCIIFIAGLEDETLLITSKHSTGTRKDTEQSHANVGEKWVDKHLATVGKTRQDLAKELRAMNATAVAELCDDSFEEHVLAYEPKDAGLYLHGINLNLPEFVTFPSSEVDKFAEKWGFKKTMYLVQDDINVVKQFLEEVAETGNYAGRDTEGFVIRCHARTSEGHPYNNWFFKFKFEEPYLMYRQWRECTRALIAGREPRIHKHTAITQEYLKYAKLRFQQNPQLKIDFNANHGIIKLREDFLKGIGVDGAEIIRRERKSTKPQLDGETSANVILVPIATIGCGKTTVALALCKLFNWGHVQNDNITGKGRPPRFVRFICEELQKYPVVIADRNNHQMRERKQLIDDLSKTVPNAKFVAIYYDHERADYDAIRQATRERIFARGDNHQTIQAQSKGEAEIIDIMEGFLDRFQPLNVDTDPDDLFDLVIKLDVVKDSRINLDTIVTALHKSFPKLIADVPSPEQLDSAISWATKDYQPNIKHQIGDRNDTRKESTLPVKNTKNSNANVEYFGVTMKASEIRSAIDATFNDSVDNATRSMLDNLKAIRRIQNDFHVTLIHKAAAKQNGDYWASLNLANNTKSDMGNATVVLERFVWDDRVMCVVVRLAGQVDGVTELKTVNDTAHITIGTADKSIKPKESNDLLVKWLARNNDTTGENNNRHDNKQTGIRELLVKGNTQLVGEIKAVMSRF